MTDLFHKITSTESSLPNFQKKTEGDIFETQRSTERKLDKADKAEVQLQKTTNKEQEREKEEFYALLRRKFDRLRLYIVCSFFVVMIDVVFIFIFPKGFLNGLNIFSLFMITLSLSGLLYLFQKQFKNINRFVYKSTVKVLYGISAIIGFFYFDMIYVIIFKFFLNSAVSFDGDFVLVPIILLMIYAGTNFVFPVLVIFQIIQIRHVMKDIGFCEGQNFSITEISAIFSIPTNESKMDV